MLADGPKNSDRSQPLEKGNTFSARLIRRMTSIRFPQIRETVCNLLYVVCDEDGMYNHQPLLSYGFALHLCRWGMQDKRSGTGKRETNSSPNPCRLSVPVCLFFVSGTQP